MEEEVGTRPCHAHIENERPTPVLYPVVYLNL